MYGSDYLLTHSIPVLVIGIILDSLIGDPYGMPHPIRLFGRMIASMERWLNHGPHRRLKGILTASSLTLIVWTFFYLAGVLLRDYPYVHLAFDGIFFFFGISGRTLITEAIKVERLVQKGDIPAARQQLSMIVGRETTRLTPRQIRIAVLETLAENLSDGVIAPLFFYMLGGVPLMMAYKMINTMDSMIGYKNERYRDFGWFAARILDDAANYIPARLTALLIALTSGSRRSFRFIRLYARHHASPNSGYPESALAGVLDCRFGGPNYYHGTLVHKPYIGTNDREIRHDDLTRTYRINVMVTLATASLYILTVLLCTAVISPG